VAVLQAGKVHLTGLPARLTWAAYGRRMGPDPARMNDTTIGGVPVNNAGGM